MCLFSYAEEKKVSTQPHTIQRGKVCALHWEYCSALTFGKDVYCNIVYTTLAVRIRAIDHTLVVNHVCSKEEVLGSNPTTP